MRCLAMTDEDKTAHNSPIPITVLEEGQMVERLRAKFPLMRFCIAAVDDSVAHAMAEQIAALLRRAGWTPFESQIPNTFPDWLCIEYGDDATHAGRFFSYARQAAVMLVQELFRVRVDARTGYGNEDLDDYDLQITIGRNAGRDPRTQG